MTGWGKNLVLLRHILNGVMNRKLKNIVIRLLSTNIFFDIYFLSFLQIKILNKLRGEKKSVFKIKHLNRLNPAKKILDGYDYISKTQNNININIPNLYLYLIENALINSRSSAIIKGTNIYYEAINNNERFNEGYVERHSKKIALVHLNDIEKIDEGFFLAGNGSHNWYHWMIEILPKMMYYQSDQTNYILVDESCKHIQSMAESLGVFTKLLNFKIIYLNKHKTYKVKKLYFINEVNKVIFNQFDSKNNHFPLYYYRQNSLRSMALKFQNIYFNDNFYPEKVYLERKGSHRIAQNQRDLLNKITDRGFKNIDLITKSIDEQVNIFYKAKTLIGTTGAAWTNILFCKANSKVIIFMPNNYKAFSFYSEMAEMLSVNLSYLYYENGDNEHSKSNFTIDLQQLDNFLTTEND